MAKYRDLEYMQHDRTLVRIHVIEEWNEYGWVTFLYGEYKVQARVFEKPSKFGVFGGRVSKMAVQDRKGMVVYNYDRGLDFSKISLFMLRDIVRFIEGEFVSKQEEIA